MNFSTTEQETAAARTPLWRRFTALFTLGSMVVIAGVILAVVVAASLLMLLFIVNRSIA